LSFPPFQMPVLLPDGAAKPQQSPQKPSSFSPTKKPIVSFNVGSQVKKAIRFFTCASAAVCACYTSADQVHAQHHEETAAFEEHPAEIIYDTEFDELPPEILMKIIGQCDFNSQMHFRATSRHMHSLVEHSDLARRQVVGGVEIGTFPLASVSAVELNTLGQEEQQQEEIERERESRLEMQQQVRLRQQRLMSLSASSNNLLVPSSSSSSHSDDHPSLPDQQQKEQHILLRRLSKRYGQIVLTMDRLKFMMRRLCVCHSLHIRGVPMDDSLAPPSRRLQGCEVRDLVVDRVSTVSQESIVII
ncbi:hypothetical protein PENTCL1PPCAC_9674, partial [Pristionchus entomophagus]